MFGVRVLSWLKRNPRNDDHPSLYFDAQRYDLVEGAFATGKFLDFYRWQIICYR